jgi:hypothetical protein
MSTASTKKSHLPKWSDAGSQQLEASSQNYQITQLPKSLITPEKSMNYLLLPQTMKTTFSGSENHPTTEKSETYTAGNDSPPVFPLKPTSNQLFGATPYES